MKHFKETSLLILAHNKIVLVFQSFFLLFSYYLFVAELGVNINSQHRLMISLLLVNTLSIAVGIYLGHGYIKLKQSYIWIINKKYQNHLKQTSLLFSFVFSLLFLPFIFVDFVYSILLMLISFITLMYCFHVAIGNNNLFKKSLIILPFLYLFLLNNKYINVSIQTLFIFIHLLTMLILIIINYRKPKKHQRKQIYKLAIDKSPEILRKKHLGNKIDYFIGKVISKFKWSKFYKIDIAIMSPTSITGVNSFIYIPVVIFSSFINSYKDSSITVETLSSVIFAFLLIISFLQTLPLLKQTTKFAHIYRGNNHVVLKNKILLAIDKTLLVNSVVFTGGVLFFITVLSLSINTQYFFITSIIVLMIALSVYPILLSMNQFLPFYMVMVISLIVFFAVISFNIYWVLPNLTKALSFSSILSFIVTCLLIRLISQFIFQKISYENLINFKTTLVVNNETN